MLSSSSSPESVLSEVRKTSSKQRRLSSPALQEPKMASGDKGHTTITIILDKLNSMQTRMEDGFDRAHSDMNAFRQEIKSQVKGLQDTVKDVEKLLDNVWEEINELKETVEEHFSSQESLQVGKLQTCLEAYTRRENLQHLIMRPRQLRRLSKTCV